MGFLNRRRRQHHDYIARAAQGVGDYRSRVREGIADWGARAWDKYQQQITEAAVSYAAEAVGVSGEEALEFLGLGDLADGDAVASYEKTYESLQGYGVVGDDPTADTYIDYWYASNTPIADSPWGPEFGAGIVGDEIGSYLTEPESDPLQTAEAPPEGGEEAYSLHDLPAPETPAPEEDDDDDKPKRRRKWATPRPQP